MNARVEDVAVWSDQTRRPEARPRPRLFADGVTDVVHDVSAMFGAVAGVIVAAIFCQVVLAGRGVGLAGLVGIMLGCGLLSALASVVLGPAWATMLAPFGPRQANNESSSQ
ncbi:MAG: hypothetical protein K2P78_03600 [Gemmataceae bacterium]|nr:hypothetical protein [Gemmataceae bacterium]